MKITRIAGENIASLSAPFEVDFTSYPLREVDIFAITGSTGSGKSTLLDVVCLALFDAVPRFESSLRRSDTFLDSSGSIESSTNTKLLLTRGATKGFAEVGFSIHGQTYTARWDVRRARNNPKGKLQDAKMQLYNNSTGELFQDTRSKVKERIQHIIGLSYEQFVRAVVLAQGDFSAFLKARDDEKSDILMRITGSGIYKQLSQAIYEQHKEKQNTLEGLQKNLEKKQIPSDEEYQQVELELNATVQQVKQKQQDTATLTQKVAIIKEFILQQSRLQQAELELKNTLQETSTLPQKEQNLQRMRKLLLLKHENEKLTLLQNDLIDLENRNKQITLRIEQTTQTLEQLNVQLKQQQQQLDELNTKWEQTKYHRDKARIKEEVLQQNEGKKEQLQDQLKELKQQIVETGNIITNLQEQYKHQQHDYEVLEKWISTHNTIGENINSIPTLIAKLELIASQQHDLESTYSLVEQTRQQLEINKQNLTLVNNNLTELDKVLPESIFQLRKGLQQGEPCPICGSRTHPFATQLFEALDITPDELEKKRKELKQQQQQLTDAIIRLEQTLDTSQTDFKTKQLASSNTLQQQAYIFQQITGTELTNSTNFELWQTELLNLQNMWLKKLSEKQEVTQKLKADTKIISEKQTELKNFEQRRTSLQSLIEATNTNTLQLKQEIETLIGCKSVAKLETKHIQEKEKLATLYNSSAKNISHYEATLSELKQSYSELTTKFIPDKKTILASSQKNYTKACNDINASPEEIALSSNEAIKQEEDKLTSLRDKLHHAQTILIERKNYYEEFLAQNDTLLSTIAPDDLQQHYNTNQQILIETNSELNQLQQKQIALQVKLTTFNDLLKQVEAIKEELKQAQTEEGKWCRLASLFGSKDGKKFNILAQGFTLSRLVIFANLQLKRFAPRYQLVRVPSSLALEVVDFDMMEQRRSVHSLSGGESFLVSLALSLALSEISSYSLNIESLFIDEGFGSLDENTLSTALAALQQLNKTGRKVGIISHIASLTEQIPVRIVVKKSGNGLSKVSIETS